mmetsp:Transcript_14486/g.33790  ORF Transcript_14486/g.33790 Transcript_14486/m.33790 type:complete len:102 (-) Transcript_14486:41-346(-)
MATLRTSMPNEVSFATANEEHADNSTVFGIVILLALNTLCNKHGSILITCNNGQSRSIATAAVMYARYTLFIKNNIPTYPASPSTDAAIVLSSKGDTVQHR